MEAVSVLILPLSTTLHSSITKWVAELLTVYYLKILCTLMLSGKNTDRLVVSQVGYGPGRARRDHEAAQREAGQVGIS